MVLQVLLEGRAFRIAQLVIAVLVEAAQDLRPELAAAPLFALPLVFEFLGSRALLLAELAVAVLVELLEEGLVLFPVLFLRPILGGGGGGQAGQQADGGQRRKDSHQTHLATP